MELQELQDARRHRWHIDGSAVRTLESAREFLESVGFCTMYPLEVPVLMPTFMGAFTGTDHGIPTARHAFADSRTKEATDLMVRLLRERAAYEANLFGDTNFLLSASVFPYFYALVGDRNPRTMPKAGAQRNFSQLARDCFEAIKTKGPISKEKLGYLLGGAISDAAFDRALGELWSRLRITRVDYVPGEGAYWDVMFRWAPDAVREGIELSAVQALSALVSKYLDSVIAAEQSEIEAFFSNIVARSKVNEAVKALVAAREFSYAHVGGRPMLQITGSKMPPKTESPLKRNEPIARRRPRPVRPGSK
ncbi:MAG TPA: crosslink repair DNA glycosylase YcaQ family protein [Terriglobales bacterium]|nr:crosslink repair DNA glycosylase YcaQ family protein [Terriglobales bacterium]